MSLYFWTRRKSKKHHLSDVFLGVIRLQNSRVGISKQHSIFASARLLIFLSTSPWAFAFLILIFSQQRSRSYWFLSFSRNNNCFRPIDDININSHVFDTFQRSFKVFTIFTFLLECFSTGLKFSSNGSRTLFQFYEVLWIHNFCKASFSPNLFLSFFTFLL